MQDIRFTTNDTLCVARKIIDLRTPRVMGILNVTPDSFYDGGLYNTEKTMLLHVERMIQEGACFIDVGGYSSRPQAQDVSLEEECRRVVPAIQSIIKHFPQTLLSVDTFRAEVARRSLLEGASMINDVSGGELDKDMFATIAHHQIPYVLTHMRGTPQNMSSLTSYNDLMETLIDYFQHKIAQLHSMDVKDILIDPGFGFAKNNEQSLEILKKLEMLHLLQHPIIVGISRKSMIWKTLNSHQDEVLHATSALHAVALLKNVHILRVHDVKIAMDIVKLIKFVK